MLSADQSSYSQIAVARCISLLFSPVAVPCLFLSLAVCCTLKALRYLLFAVGDLLLADPFLLFTFIYWMLASRSLLLASRCCLVIFSRSSPLAVYCSLHITICMLLVILHSLITAQRLLLGICLSSRADRYTQLGISPRYSLRVTCFSSLTSLNSVSAGCPLFALHCSLLASHSSLVASKTWSLIARRSLSDVCDALHVDRFSLLGSCSSMLGCVWYLADRRLLHSAFNSLLTAFYVILSTGRKQLIFASRCSLMAVRCS